MSICRFHFRLLAPLGGLLSALACAGADMTLTEGEAEDLGAELASLPPDAESPEALGESAQALTIEPGGIVLPFCPEGVVAEDVTLFNGGDFADVVTGTIDPDKLLGGLCPDTLSGLAGDDELKGGPGNDTLKGGNGDDELLGGEGDDHLQGGHHNDVLFGGPGADVLEGGNDDDELHGGCGPEVDTLDGGHGFDRCEGNCSRDNFIDCEVIRCC